MNAPIPAWVGGVLEPVPEIEVHRRGLRHPAVAIFVARGPFLLIRQQEPAAYLAPGLWSSACHAHPAWDEAPAACARRLLRDAVPAAAGAPHWRGVAEYRAVLAGGFVEHERVEVFLARDPSPATQRGAGRTADPLEDARGNPVEALGAGRPDAIWIDVEDLRAEMRRRAERFCPWLRVALSEHLSLVLG